MQISHTRFGSLYLNIDPVKGLSYNRVNDSKGDSFLRVGSGQNTVVHTLDQLTKVPEYKKTDEEQKGLASDLITIQQEIAQFSEPSAHWKVYDVKQAVQKLLALHGEHYIMLGKGKTADEKEATDNHIRFTETPTHPDVRKLFANVPPDGTNQFNTAMFVSCPKNESLRKTLMEKILMAFETKLATDWGEAS